MGQFRVTTVAATPTVVLAIVPALGCDSVSDPLPPAAIITDAGGTSLFIEPTPPEPPAPVSLGPCPSGWREVAAEAGAVVCEPWPEGGAQDCTGASAHFPGEPGCTPIGAPCPAGPWADDLPAGAVLYVMAGAPAGGAGTPSSPMSTIAEAVAIATNGDVIAVAKGTYDEIVVLPAGVTLWGACASETVLTSSQTGLDAGVVTAQGGGTAIARVSLTGELPGLWVGPGDASMTATDVVVDGARRVGVRVSGLGTLIAHNLVVRNTRATLEGKGGFGVQVSEGARIELARASIEDNLTAGVLGALGGSTLVLRDVAVRRTSPLGGKNGVGLQVQDQAVAQLERVVVENNHSSGLVAIHAGSNLDAVDLVVRDTTPSSTGGGEALNVVQSASAVLRRALLERSRHAGALVDAGTLVAEDLFVRDVVSDTQDGTGRGLSAQGGEAHVELRRAAFVRAVESAISAFGEGTELVAEDLTIESTLTRPADGLAGHAVYLQAGASVELHRALLDRSAETALAAFDAGTVLVAEDVEVRDTLGTADGIRGRGLEADFGAHASVTRGAFVRSRDVGVAAFGTGSLVELTDVLVTRTLERACVVSTCAGQGSGHGIGSYDGASIVMTRFASTDNALTGLQLASGGTMDLSLGLVANNPIGVNLQTDPFDVVRLQHEVRYLHNGRNLDSEHLPVPEIATPLVPE